MQKGYGPFSHPDLIVCGNHSLLKLTADPYPTKFTDDGYLFYASSSNYNISILVELICARLVRKIELDFFEDNQIEPINPFLIAQFYDDGKQQGWTFCVIPWNNQFESTARIYTPYKISSEAFSIFRELQRHPIDMKEINFKNHVEKHSSVISEILNTKLVAIKDNETLYTIVNNLQIVFCDGECWVGDDTCGYFSQWLFSKRSR